MIKVLFLHLKWSMDTFFSFIIFIYGEKRQSHSCAILISPILAPIRDVHDVILGEGANLLDACCHTLPDEVTFEYLSPSIFRLEENASYHFSNLVTWLSYLQMAFL